MESYADRLSCILCHLLWGYDINISQPTYELIPEATFSKPKVFYDVQHVLFSAHQGYLNQNMNVFHSSEIKLSFIDLTVTG